MKPKTLVVLMTIILASNFFISLNYIENSKADVLPKFYVDNDYDSSTPGWQVDHFNSIQDAIDVSSPGDRIVIYAGIYSESISIPHKLDLFGEDKTLTTITGADSGDRITISASNVNISHFTIQNCGSLATNAVIVINSGNTIITDNIIQSGAKHGIYINNCDDNTIYDNTIGGISLNRNSGNGIYFNHSDSNTITYNSIFGNLNNGLFLYNSSNNIIHNNAGIYSNSLNGIFLNETSNYNSIINNVIYSNSKNGIFLNDHCNYNTISSSTIYSNSNSGIRIENSSSNTMSTITTYINGDYGIMIVGSSNTIQSNTIYSNGDHGIFLFADDNNVISSNIVYTNTLDGIRLSNSTNDSIYTNEIYSNSRYGINLDYFTMNNLIYNNYFHDNTDNAVDKSTNNNLWNIAKTSGTNVVGGSYKCGNYWDDFDEPSEEAYNAGDGIANAHSINVSSTDYGPILDVTAPVIGVPQISPSSQTVGGYTYISVTASDNTEIRNVYLQILDPNNQTTNFSIFQNKTGNTYYCNKIYSTVGTYSFFIGAKDPRNWARSINKTFYINEGTPPTVIDNTPTIGSPSRTFTFNATVTDDLDIASQLTVKVQWRHGGEGENYTLQNVFGNYFEKEVTLDNKTDSLSYTFYAFDHWGNSITTLQKTVNIIDSESPDLFIKKYGPSPDILPNSYTFGATITDNTEVADVTIEYWYETSNHMTVEMDKKPNDYYEKTIIISENPDRVYCIIYATDMYGNQNDTKNPFANASGHYNGVIGTEITFSSNKSFDLDGNITDYTWYFGDGTTGTGKTTTHEYLTNGNYTIKLVITDNDGNTDINVTYALIISSIQQKTSSATINEIENEYGITLTELFYGYDSDGDYIVDTFLDPNNVLQAVHNGIINISGNIVFLLSVNDENIPEFMWNTTTDEIIDISYIKGTLGVPIINYEDKTAIVDATVNKIDGWIYIEVDSPDLGDYGKVDSLISVIKNGTFLNSDRLMQKDSKFYFLDDPETKYFLNFSFSPLTLGYAEFTPENGGKIDENNPTIIVKYDVAVDVVIAEIYRLDADKMPIYSSGIDITNKLITEDYKTFTYSFPSDLIDGEYEITIYVDEKFGTKSEESSAIYSYFSWAIEEMEISLQSILMIISLIGGVAVAIYLIIRFKNISFESFIYIKNKKIIPFFKPLVFGPLKFDVNDEKVKKAEFYVNGKLKDTITQKPFIWNWNERSFMKKTIETKIYDQEGKTSSSGKMTFFVFNSPRFFK